VHVAHIISTLQATTSPEIQSNSNLWNANITLPFTAVFTVQNLSKYFQQTAFFSELALVPLAELSLVHSRPRAPCGEENVWWLELHFLTQRHVQQT